MPNDVRVTGIQANVKALEKVDDLDLKRAGTEAVKALIPDVRANSRSDTGTLRGGWEAQESAFVNTVEYSPFQEFGTVYIEGTFAIRRSIENNEDKLRSAFEKEQERAAAKAGFSS